MGLLCATNDARQAKKLHLSLLTTCADELAHQSGAKPHNTPPAPPLVLQLELQQHLHQGVRSELARAPLKPHTRVLFAPAPTPGCGLGLWPSTLQEKSKSRPSGSWWRCCARPWCRPPPTNPKLRSPRFHRPWRWRSIHWSVALLRSQPSLGATA